MEQLQTTRWVAMCRDQDHHTDDLAAESWLLIQVVHFHASEWEYLGPAILAVMPARRQRDSRFSIRMRRMMKCWVEVSRKKPMAKRVIDVIMIVTSTKHNLFFFKCQMCDHPAHQLSIPAHRGHTCCGIKPKVISSRSSRSKASINGPRDVWLSRMWSLPGSRCTSTWGECGHDVLSWSLDIKSSKPNQQRRHITWGSFRMGSWKMKWI